MVTRRARSHSFLPTAAALFISTAAGTTLPAAVTIGAQRDRVCELIAAGRYAEAEAGAHRLLVAAEATSGPRSAETAGALDLVVESRYFGRDRGAPETKEFAARAVMIREHLPVQDDSALGRSLHNLGAVVYSQLEYAAARAYLERALMLRERALGPDHPEVAASIWLLGELFLDLDDRDQARRSFERSLEIRERALGPDHPDVAVSLMSLAKCDRLAGDFAPAEARLERALAIRERALGPDHPEVSKSLYALGIVCQTQGDYARARKLHERALSIQLATVGPEHPLVAYSHLALASLEHVLGDYAAARADYQAAESIIAGLPEANHPQNAMIESNLALLLAASGDVAEAVRRQEHVVATFRGAMGDSSTQLANQLTRLGQMHLAAGDTVAARTSFETARSIYAPRLAPDAIEWVGVDVGLAVLDMNAGRLAEAEHLSDRCMEIARRTLEPTQHVFPDLLSLAAEIRLRRQDAAGARRLYAEALALTDAMPGANLPQVVEIREGYAIALALGGERDRALAMALAAAHAAREHVVLTARTLPERQALAYAEEMRESLDLAVSLFAAQPGTPRDAPAVWDAVTRARALVLDEAAARNATWRAGDDSGVKRLAEDFRAARLRLANLLVRGPGGVPVDHYERLLQEARREGEAAEEALAEHSLEYRRAQARQSTGVAAALGRLPPRTALIAFTLFDRVPLAPASMVDWRTRGTPTYAAFVGTAREDEPAWVTLGTAAEIDALVQAWRNQVVAVSGPWSSPRAAEEACRKAGAALAARVWEPLVPHLGDAERVFLVPDGSLGRVAFAALPAGEDRYRVEAGPEIHILAAEKDLVPDPGASVTPGSGLLALGGADFDQSAPAADLSPTTPIGPPAGAVFRGPRSHHRRFESIVFEPLPATVQEIDEVIAIWVRSRGAGRRAGARTPSVVRLTGSNASEEALKRLAPGHAILHLATHGFFLDGSDAPAAAPRRRGIGGVYAIAVHVAPAAGGENPLALSGLAVAGANRRAEARPGMDDGILTAEEIATLDLAGIEWVVLSACDTGLGEIRTGEGILGLRRAFAVAGARTLIMSLWAVEDQAAREWMRALYEGRFAEGRDTAGAVHHATLSTLAARRERGAGTHPFYWAGFVASGDWR